MTCFGYNWRKIWCKEQCLYGYQASNNHAWGNGEFCQQRSGCLIHRSAIWEVSHGRNGHWLKCRGDPQRKEDHPLNRKGGIVQGSWWWGQRVDHLNKIYRPNWECQGRIELETLGTGMIPFLLLVRYMGSGKEHQRRSWRSLECIESEHQITSMSHSIGSDEGITLSESASA